MKLTNIMKKLLQILLFALALLLSPTVYAEIMDSEARPTTNVPAEKANGQIILNENHLISIITLKTAIAPDTIPVLNITGKVTDKSGRPIPGATIKIKGTNKGEQTDDSGRFRLYDIKINSQLVVSSVGFDKRQISVNEKSTLTIVLDSSIRVINPVNVYSTGLQLIPKERLASSISETLKGMYDSRISTDVLSRIEAITPGVVFNRTANGIPDIAIRGISTINADKRILTIVDNFPYEGDPNNINPNDVLSITVLKDAAAASIWGARSGNGVLVITTKKGNYSHKPKTNLYANLTFQGKPQLNKSRDFINSSDFIDLETFLFKKGYYNGDLNNTLSFPPVTEAVEILNQEHQGLLTPQQAADQLDLLRKNDLRNELAEHFYQPVLRQQYGASFSGGLPSVNYLLSMGYDRNREARVGDNYSRITLRSVNSIKLIDDVIELTSDINYVLGETTTNTSLANTMAGADGKMIPPYTKFTDANGAPISIIKDYRKGYGSRGENSRLLNWEYFPIEEISLSDNRSKQSDLRITMGLKSRITDYISLDLQYQYQRANTDNRIFYSDESYYVRNLVNRFATVSLGAPIVYNMPRGAQVEFYNKLLAVQNLRAKINLDKNWDNNVLSAIVGFDWRQADITSNKNYFFGYNSATGSKSFVRFDTAYPTAPYGAEYIKDPSTGIEGSTNRNRSWFGNVSYTYNDKYTVTASARVDQANIFGVRANQKTTPLWSAGAMWNLKNEFFQQVKWLQALKLRATLGVNANVMYNLTAYTTGILYPVNTPTQPPYSTILAPGNPNITWERTKMLNLGVDYNISNHITGSIEYYSKKGIDLIGVVPVASSSGFVNILNNYASIKGSGVDVLLNFVNIGNTVKFNTSFNFSYNTDKVTHYVGDANLQIGRPIQGVYSYKWAGLDTAGNPQGYLNGTISKAYLNLISVPISEKVFNGHLNPKITGGLSTTATFKNLSAFFNVQYKFGYYFINNSILYDNLFKRGIGNSDYANRWKSPGDEKLTYVPARQYPVDPGRDAYYKDAEVHVKKGDHIRLQDAGISYSFTRKQFKKLPFSNVQLSLNVSNIGILWRANDAGVDPDYQTVIPPSASYSIGIKVAI